MQAPGAAIFTQVSELVWCNSFVTIEFFDLNMNLKREIEPTEKAKAILRGYIQRRRNLPNVLRAARQHVSDANCDMKYQHADGRVDSIEHEGEIVKCLQQQFGERIRVAKVRWWYDILLHDYYCGWIPVNIKTTTMRTSDNVGNLTICAYAYTNLNVGFDKKRNIGYWKERLPVAIANKRQLNRSNRDYYFLVVNKSNPADVVVNGLRGIDCLTCNASNLPFQIKWMTNRKYKLLAVNTVVAAYVAAASPAAESSKETYLRLMRNLKL